MAEAEHSSSVDSQSSLYPPSLVSLPSRPGTGLLLTRDRTESTFEEIPVMSVSFLFGSMRNLLELFRAKRWRNGDHNVPSMRVPSSLRTVFILIVWAVVLTPMVDFSDIGAAFHPRGADRSRDNEYDYERMRLAEEIRDACVNVGFFYIKSHGIPEQVIQRVVETGKRYFEQSVEDKMKLDIHKTNNFKGYTALLGENTDVENGAGDVHEGFDIGWEAPPGGLDSVTTDSGESSKGIADLAMSGGNVWPDGEGMEEFREAMLDYYHRVLGVGKLLFPLFALALDLPEDFFDDKTTKPAAIMRLLHYPPQNPTNLEESRGRQIGIGAHTDYECFTILWQDTCGGLQVQNAQGRWVDAIPIPGTLVVNLGDQFARWTNDVFKSTLHRVINRSGHERYSIPLFFGTDYDVLLEPIPTCLYEGETPKYEVMTAGEYVKSRLEATYAHSVN